MQEISSLAIPHGECDQQYWNGTTEALGMKKTALASRMISEPGSRETERILPSSLTPGGCLLLA